MSAQDPYEAGGPLEAAWLFFEGAELPMPPVPEPFLGRLAVTGPNVFSSRPEVRSLAPLDRWVDEALAGDAVPYVAFGHEGHGTNAWFLRYAVVIPGLAVFVETRFGNAYDDAEAARGTIFGAFRAIERLLTSSRPPGPMLVVDHRPDSRSRWRHAGEPDWHRSDDALAHLTA